MPRCAKVEVEFMVTHMTIIKESRVYIPRKPTDQSLLVFVLQFDQSNVDFVRQDDTHRVPAFVRQPGTLN